MTDRMSITRKMCSPLFKRAIRGFVPDRLQVVIGPHFSIWIGGRWGVAGGRSIAPARRIFRESKPFLDFPAWPSGEQSVSSHYAFFPSISLAVAFQPMTSLIQRESAILLSPLTLTKSRGFEQEHVHTIHTRDVIWNYFRLLREKLNEVRWKELHHQTITSWKVGPGLFKAKDDLFNVIGDTITPKSGQDRSDRWRFNDKNWNHFLREQLAVKWPVVDQTPDFKSNPSGTILNIAKNSFQFRDIYAVGGNIPQIFC